MRPRREVQPVILLLLRVVFRYSKSREAYVLRFIGNKTGPVLRAKDRLQGSLSSRSR